jgi:hypothetical protein
VSLKRALLGVAALVWAGVVFGAWIAIDQGLAGPAVSFADVPGGSTGGMAGAMVAAVAGWMLIGYARQRVQRGEWKQTGREAGLRPTGSGSPPELMGTVDGRTVRARLEHRTVNSGGEGASRRVPYTVVEAGLDGPADHGLVGGPADGELDADIGTLRFEAVVEHADVADDLVAVEEQGLAVAGTAETAVETLATGTMGDALRSDDQLNLLSVGDAAGVVASFAEARNAEMEGAGSSLAEYPVDNLREELPGDAGTATVETHAHIQDGDALRGQAAAVVAIADVFEEARATPSSPD